MTVLAHSLKRIWSAKNRGSLPNMHEQTSLVGLAYDGVLALNELARQTAPTILPIVWNIFR
jgi:hypothetical protein